MATITLSLPDELKVLMEQHPEIKWSEVFRKMILLKLQHLKKLKTLEQGGKL